MVLVDEIRQGDVSSVRRMIATDPSLLAMPLSRDGTALHVAILCHQDEMTRMLLDLGADSDSPGRWQGTPLQLAAWAGNVDVVDMLLERGVSPENGGNAGRMTPIVWAAIGSRGDRETGSDHVAVVKRLLSAGATAVAFDAQGRTASSLASAAVGAVLDAHGGQQPGAMPPLRAADPSMAPAVPPENRARAPQRRPLTPSRRGQSFGQESPGMRRPQNQPPRPDRRVPQSPPQLSEPINPAGVLSI
jgi:ankyrin repeat protein